MTDAATYRRRRLGVALAVLATTFAVYGAAHAQGAPDRPVTGVDALVDRAESRGNVVCARPALRDRTGPLFVRCVDALGEPIRLLYSTDTTLIAAAEKALVDAGWSTAGQGAVRVAVRGGLAPSMASSLAGMVG